MSKLKFIDLFAGIGGFHQALSALGHQCVFASELDPVLRELYARNFREMRGPIIGDIRSITDHARDIPVHDVLCAGFPCQPFSKSGGQLGTKDETRGTLFHEILRILEAKKPAYVLLENVGNFERHDHGRTYRIVKERLERLGYQVAGTEHLTPPKERDWRDVGLDKREGRWSPKVVGQASRARGVGLISPHHFGHPQHRERFFIVAVQGSLPSPAFPQRPPPVETSLATIVSRPSELSAADRALTRLTEKQVRCIQLWNKLLKGLPPGVEPQSFPIWSDEFGARYPFHDRTPSTLSVQALRRCIPCELPRGLTTQELLEYLPSYAREDAPKFREWKVRFIRQNRNWWLEVKPHAPKGWLDAIRQLPPSLRKLEWNVRGGELDLWKHVLQFRPSGLRAKRYCSSPALVAMTATQIPILGPQRRFLTTVEGLRLQGFPDDHLLPTAREKAFKALGNAVHVDVVKRIAAHLLDAGRQSRSTDLGRPREVA